MRAVAGGAGAGPPATPPPVLAVRSLVFGTCNLVLLGVPAGWRLGTGAFPPEVDRWQVRDGVSWATAGRGHWWLTAGADAVPSEPEAAGGPGRARNGRAASAGDAEQTAGGVPARQGYAGRCRPATVRVELFLDLTPAAAPAPHPGRNGPRALPPASAGTLGRVAAQGVLAVAGHRGWWARGEVRRGFPGKWRPARVLVLDCPETARRIRIRLETAAGSGEAELELAWQALLHDWRCH